MATYQIGYFIGSLSSKSINRILSKALIRLAPHDLEFTEIQIGGKTPSTTFPRQSLAHPLGRSGRR